MKTREDELARSHRIAKELRRLQELKREQDQQVQSLMRGVGAWQLEHAEIPDELRARFESPPTASPVRDRRSHSIGALRA